MIKVVINVCHGGYGLSREALDRYCAENSIDPGEWDEWGFYSNISHRDILRDDELLVRIVEELGELASGKYAELKVVEIPDDVLWHIAEYDGYEHIAEDHRTWG